MSLPFQWGARIEDEPIPGVFCKECLSIISCFTCADHDRDPKHRKNMRERREYVTNYVDFLVAEMTGKKNLVLVARMLPCAREVTSRIGQFLRGRSPVHRAPEFVTGTGMRGRA